MMAEDCMGRGWGIRASPLTHTKEGTEQKYGGPVYSMLGLVCVGCPIVARRVCRNLCDKPLVSRILG